MGMIRTLYRGLEQAGKVLAYAGMVLILIAILASIIDISGRKTIALSIPGINDITQLMVMSCICLAMPYAFIREGHVGVEFVTDPLPRRALAVLKSVVALLTLVFVAVLLRYGYAQAALQVGKGDSSLTLGIPIIWYWMPLLIGLGVSVLACLTVALRYLSMAARGTDPLGLPHREPGGI
ncbi:MAG: TRAP transporter small permease [Betaproteobacteria bacterium]|nr:TRAP transporter small permease [Betaproteobacteria bacterium]